MRKGFAVWFASMMLACGGGKSGESTTPSEGEQAPPAQDGASQMVAPEDIDEIQNRLDRKRAIVSRCLSMAVDNKELPKNSRGRITLGIDIEPNGRAGDIKIVKATLESKSLTDCVIGHVREIQFPEVPKTYPTTYTYAFEAM